MLILEIAAGVILAFVVLAFIGGFMEGLDL